MNIEIIKSYKTNLRNNAIQCARFLSLVISMLICCNYLYGQHYVGEIVYKEGSGKGYWKLISGPYTEYTEADTYRNKNNNKKDILGRQSNPWAEVIKLNDKFWVANVETVTNTNNSQKLEQSNSTTSNDSKSQNNSISLKYNNCIQHKLKTSTFLGAQTENIELSNQCDIDLIVEGDALCRDDLSNNGKWNWIHFIQPVRTHRTEYVPGLLRIKEYKITKIEKL